MFNTYDEISHSVSDAHYQVTYPACNDTFYVDADAWWLIENNAPVELIEQYYSCTLRPTDAIFNAIGIATGNTALFIPLLCFFCLPLLYSYLQLSNNVPLKADYSKGELDAAEKALALIILRIRDGKLRGIKKTSVLTKMTSELVSAAKTESGYADSDDDSDSDDEEGGGRKSVSGLRGASRRSSHRKGAGAKGPYFQSSVFLEKRDDGEDTGDTSGSARGSLSLRGETEFDLPTVAASDLIVLNNGSGGRLRSLSPPEYLCEVEGMVSAMQRAMGVKGKEEAKAAYKVAQAKTEALSKIYLKKQTDIVERGQLSVKIYNLLMLHVCLEYACSMATAVDEYSFRTAYNIGGRNYSGADLLGMKNQEL
jgi:hypothetical protein